LFGLWYNTGILVAIFAALLARLAVMFSYCFVYVILSIICMKFNLYLFIVSSRLRRPRLPSSLNALQSWYCSSSHNGYINFTIVGKTVIIDSSCYDRANTVESILYETYRMIEARRRIPRRPAEGRGHSSSASSQHSRCYVFSFYVTALPGAFPNVKLLSCYNHSNLIAPPT